MSVADQISDSSEQALDLDGLREEAFALGPGPDLVVRREEDDRGAWPELPHPPEEAPAVEPGHLEVGDDEIGAKGREEPRGLLPVRGNLVAPLSTRRSRRCRQSVP